MKVALVQMDTVWENHAANHEKALFWLEQASAQGCNIAVFPEMFATGFSRNVHDVAEDENGATHTLLSRLAARHHIFIVAGFAVRVVGQQKVENSAVIYDRTGERICRYVKLHPFSFAGEDRFVKAGTGTEVFLLEEVPASVFVCYDLRFPEAFRRVAPSVAVIFVIANWPSSRQEHWQALLRARAIENLCFMVGVNRTGTDGNGLEYAGGSCVFDPSGRQVVRAGSEERCVVAEFDPRLTTTTRETFPFLNDMKPQ